MVIFNKDVAKYVKTAAESLCTNTKLGLLCTEDFDCFYEAIETQIADAENEPVIVKDVRTDTCLMFWNIDLNGFQNKIEYLTHADAFLTGMEHCDSLSGSVMHGDHSYFSKLGILFPLIAFERKMTYILGITHQSFRSQATALQCKMNKSLLAPNPASNIQVSSPG